MNQRSNLLIFTGRSTNIGSMGRVSDARDRLIDSAVDLIYSRSYAAVGVQEICLKAGVKKGSFYHFFPSKRDLTLAALEHILQGTQASIVEPAFSSGLPPLRRVERLVELMYQQQQQWFEVTGKVLGCPFGNLALEMSTQDELLRARLDVIFRGAEANIEKALNDACAEGSLPDIDTKLAAKAIFAYIEGLLMLAKTENNPERISQLGKAAIGLARAMEKHTEGGEVASVS